MAKQRNGDPHPDSPPRENREASHTGPIRTGEQDSPEPERLVNPQEETAGNFDQAERPSQAEGERDQGVH